MRNPKSPLKWEKQRQVRARFCLAYMKSVIIIDGFICKNHLKNPALSGRLCGSKLPRLAPKAWRML